MFLYFIPGQVFSGVPAALKYAFEGNTITKIQSLAGPQGSGQGTLLAMGELPAELMRVDEQSQEWKRIPQTNLYCGCYNDRKPTPSQLQREELIEGHSVELGDGSRWQCAIARGFDLESKSTYCPLPRSLQFDLESGRWLPNTFAPPHKRFVDLALSYVATIESAIESGEKTFQFPEIDELAILGLTVNYRVSAVELSFLEHAYTVKSRQLLIDAILDMPTIARWSKKKIETERAGSAT